MHFVSGCDSGILLINLCEELPYIGNQETGLLQSREVSAPAVAFAPVQLRRVKTKRPAEDHGNARLSFSLSRIQAS
jgi:hypothetical protein